MGRPPERRAHLGPLGVRLLLADDRGAGPYGGPRLGITSCTSARRTRRVAPRAYVRLAGVGLDGCHSLMVNCVVSVWLLVDWTRPKMVCVVTLRRRWR
jgi:hypothetical protein